MVNNIVWLILIGVKCNTPPILRGRLFYVTQILNRLAQLQSSHLYLRYLLTRRFRKFELMTWGHVCEATYSQKIQGKVESFFSKVGIFIIWCKCLSTLSLEKLTNEHIRLCYHISYHMVNHIVQLILIRVKCNTPHTLGGSLFYETQIFNRLAQLQSPTSLA